jgi:ribosomal subunit interface protein
MIHKVEITGVHTVPDDQIKDYLKNSIAKLEHYIPKHARDSAHIDAKLIENRSQGDKKCTVEIILYLPRVPVAAKESCATMPEAIDLVEGKIVAQLKKYKDTHTNPRLLRRLTNKLRRQTAE